MRKATYKEIPELLENLESFTGNSMTAIYIPELQLYYVMSYETVIAVVCSEHIYLNNIYYSNTTSRQQNIIRRVFEDVEEVSHSYLVHILKEFYGLRGMF